MRREQAEAFVAGLALLASLALIVVVITAAVMAFT